MTCVEAKSYRKKYARHAKAELFRIGRFGLVGVAATCAHMLIACGLIMSTDLPALFANALAFVTAFGISFSGHYFWTFASSGNPTRAMRRFFVISVTAFLANSLLLAQLIRFDWMSAATSAATAAAIIPVISFLGGRLWAFRAEAQ